MAANSSDGLLSVKHTLTRTRSSTSPSSLAPPRQEIDSGATGHPAIDRSQSYTVDAERDAPVQQVQEGTGRTAEHSRLRDRLHIGGRHHGSTSKEEQKLQRKHRYTQSESQQYQRQSPSNPQRLPTTSAASSQSEAGNDFLSPTSRGGAVPNLIRMASYRSARNHQQAEGVVSGSSQMPPLRRRQTSDPVSPSENRVSAGGSSGTTQTPIDPIVADLERADARRRASQRNATEADIQKLNARLEGARAELSARLSSTTHVSSTLLRRLDDAHDTLHRTTESLLDTISSFADLSQQSDKLLQNFDKETRNLDIDVHRKIGRFKTQVCETRSQRVTELEAQGHSLNEKAKELGQRLENCRKIVHNWELREINKRKAWKGIWSGVFWALLLIFISAATGVIAWKVMEIKSARSSAQATLSKLIANDTFHEEIHSSNTPPSTATHSGVTQEQSHQPRLPEDVKEILREIEMRNRRQTRLTLHEHGVDTGFGTDRATLAGAVSPSSLSPALEWKPKISERDDKRIRLLDEL